MYYYILDPQNIGEKAFEERQIALQGYLAEFKINGEMGRVTPLRSIQSLVETASERGVKTLVACGTDETFNLMLSYLQGRDFTIGFIPLTDNSYIAKIFGLKSLYDSVKILAARRVVKIDLATVAKSYFVSYLEFGIASSKIKDLSWWGSMKALSVPAQELSVRIDDSYTMNLTCIGGIVANTRSTSSDSETIANPTDGYLDLLVIEKLTKYEVVRYKEAIMQGQLEKIPGCSVIKCRKLEFLEPNGFPLTISGRVLTKVPATVEIIQKRLRVVVGKSRTF
jgi:diacylglycerol kinase family enzyme